MLASAVELGRRFAAHLDVLHIHADWSSLMPLVGEGLPPSTIEEIMKEAEKAAEDRLSTARAVYERVCSATEVSASWRVASGEKPSIAAMAGRLSDLIVVGGPDDPDDAAWRATLDSVLFDSGRPVLLLRKPLPFIGQRVAVAWNGSAQIAHAVAAALPFLRLAKQVTILSAGPVDPYASTSGLLAYLARHDIQATAREFEPAYVPIGQALLEQSRLLQSDLLVIGAYGHSRLREMILGGATREVTALADLPVLMAH